MATIHISKEEAERNFADLLSRVNDRTSFVIEDGSHPVALLLPPEPKALTLDEAIAKLELMEKAKRDAPLADDTFADDLDAAIASRRESFDPSILE